MSTSTGRIDDRGWPTKGQAKCGSLKRFVSRSGLMLAAAATLLSIGCGSSTDNYLREVTPLAKQYNDARDKVEKAMRDVEAAIAPSQQLARAESAVARMEDAIAAMSEAYRAFGQKDVAERFREHQTATLQAWHAGIEATVASRAYLTSFLSSGFIDDSLMLRANSLFGEEDLHQLGARRALDDAR